MMLQAVQRNMKTRIPDLNGQTRQIGIARQAFWIPCVLRYAN
jgi:hypothetical protein